MSILSNKKNGKVVLHFSANSANVIVAGNSSVSNIAAGNSTVYENVVSASITKVAWGVGANSVGYWEVKRDSSIVLELPAAGVIDLSKIAAINVGATANISANLVGGSATGFIVIEMNKALQNPVQESY